MSYCSVCGNNHDGSACPIDKSPYDEAMDVIDKLKAALAEKDKELKKAKGCDLRMGDDFGDDPIECVLVLKKQIAALTAELKMERDRNKVCGIVVRENEALTAENAELREAKTK